MLGDKTRKWSDEAPAAAPATSCPSATPAPIVAIWLDDFIDDGVVPGTRPSHTHAHTHPSISLDIINRHFLQKGIPVGLLRVTQVS